MVERYDDRSFFYSSNGNIFKLFQPVTFAQRVSLSEKKANKHDSAAFFPPPSDSVIILHRAERKPSVAGESILTRQLSQPLRMQEQPRRWRPHRSDWWKHSQWRYSQCTANTQTCTRWRRRAYTYTCMGGFIAMATCDWSPELCCERERERILMTGKKKRRRMESDGIVGEHWWKQRVCTQKLTQMCWGKIKELCVWPFLLSRCRLSCSGAHYRLCGWLFLLYGPLL